MIKILKWISDFLPVSRKAYLRDMGEMLDVIQGLVQSEAQHAQIETNLIRSVGFLENNSKGATKNNSKKGNDVAFG